MKSLAKQFGTELFEPFRNKLLPLAQQCDRELSMANGKAAAYRQLLMNLPAARTADLDLAAEKVRIGSKADLNATQREDLITILKGLHPWRKGPFDVFGTIIDSEWRSDLKWDRVKDRMAPLADRKILDIGSSSGYYLFRMVSGEPRLAIGLEPYQTFFYQYQVLQHFIRAPQIFCLPNRFDDFPVLDGFFDTVFCMGILYHSRTPIDMLNRIRRQLDKDGELVLETLIIKGEDDTVLCPYPRYAKMNNAYFLPTVRCLEGWLQRAGFTNIRCVDVTPTTPEEQRKTEWMTFESLSDFLDSNDPTRTIEGYPAPVRAILLAGPK